jgi:hypothetical protein
MGGGAENNLGGGKCPPLAPPLMGPKVWVVSGIFNLFERTSLLCLGEAKRHLVVMSSVNKCTA